jgi:tRNA 2-selenouridine synthase
MVLSETGFAVTVLDGGYRAFRRAVMAELEQLPARLQFTVLAGRTGSAESRLLQALAEAGAQVLDLEALARHRGSVLGLVPGDRQPSQKAFETSAAGAHFSELDPARPVFAEGESRTIGRLRLPEALLLRLRRGSSAPGADAAGRARGLPARRVRALRGRRRCLLRPAPGAA